MHFLLLQDSCYSAADGQEGGLSLLYQNRSPFSPVSQTTESDHVLTWHCRNEVVGRREHKENPACAALQLLAPERETQRGIQVLHSMWNLSSPVRGSQREMYKRHGGLPFPQVSAISITDSPLQDSEKGQIRLLSTVVH